MKKISFLFIVIFLQTSCSNSHNNINQNKLINKNSLNIIVKNIISDSENTWNDNKIFMIEHSKVYNYNNKNITLINIDFTFKKIVIETDFKKDPKNYLRQAIIIALLLNNDFSDFDQNNKYNILQRKEPLLYGQVVDNYGVYIRHKWRANKFANYLLKTNLKTYKNNKKQIWSVSIPLKFNRSDKRANKYLNFIYKSSKRYNVDKSLILAIIEAESNFNPHAISNSNALGLMQIVQHTAGKDVFKMRGKLGYPSKNALLNPEKNIDIGTAYLSLLRDNYLSSILNPISKRYAMIASYHGGVSAMLTTFSSNQIKAFHIINNLSPEEVYRLIYKKHPSIESRRYLFKVYNLQKAYCK
ncbi:mltC [Wigglesworthia glossinidia endosymbiont of Glossina brevipalpis]|uniref:peptidoglycan lytic exotransglycosylase n=1 Tax=Wigglesworthia glossinidia brevipalpis TaxID=36870 RepID=Q8D3C6_WIGBR|nr:mltC [Wigglesworthia glossinidia endosymbiont of Glossina brevipalpis]